MAILRQMPRIAIDQGELARFGRTWAQRGGSLGRTPPESSMELGYLVDGSVGSALAEMLGGIPTVAPSQNALMPAETDCVEVGPVLVVGGVRPQRFDVGYRPDGVRFAFDSKTLNDTRSIGKNWQNMINDLATEATTVHSRFPYAVVGFIVLLPGPCVDEAPRTVGAIIQTLERLAGRDGVDDLTHLAEAISLVVWDPTSGRVSPDVPDPSSILRLDRFSAHIEVAYSGRYKGLPPHDA